MCYIDSWKCFSFVIRKVFYVHNLLIMFIKSWAFINELRGIIHIVKTDNLLIGMCVAIANHILIKSDVH